MYERIIRDPHRLSSFRMPDTCYNLSYISAGESYISGGELQNDKQRVSIQAGINEDHSCNQSQSLQHEVGGHIGQKGENSLTWVG